MVEVNVQPEVRSDTLLLLEQLRCLTTILGEDLREHCQLTLDEYRVMALVAEKPVMQKVLAYDMDRSFSLVSRCVTMLSRFGYVARRSPEPGIPGCEVAMTRRGRHQLRRARKHLAERLHVLGGDLSNVEISVLTRIEKNMRTIVR